jgi:hypothetical protein
MLKYISVTSLVYMPLGVNKQGHLKIVVLVHEILCRIKWTCTTHSLSVKMFHCLIPDRNSQKCVSNLLQSKYIYIYEVSVLGVSEVRWKRQGEMRSGNYTVCYSGGERAERGVAAWVCRLLISLQGGFCSIPHPLHDVTSPVSLLHQLPNPPFSNIVQQFLPNKLFSLGCPEDGGSNLIQNFCNKLPANMVSHLRWP